LKKKHILLFIFFLYFFCSVKLYSQKNIYRFTNNNISKKELVKNAEIIKKRIVFCYNTKVKLIIPEDTSFFKISVHKLKKSKEINPLIFSKGDFMIYVNSENLETEKFLKSEISGRECIKSQLNNMIKNKRSYNPGAFGFCKLSDISKVDSVLNIKQNKEVYKDSISFFWDAKEENTGIIRLISVKNIKKGDIVINNNSINNVRIIKNVYSGYDIEITFTDEYKELFSEFTEKNIHKVIHIVIDKKVYFSPVIQEQIKEGKAIITFPNGTNISEIRLLASVLKFPGFSEEMQIKKIN